MHPLHRRFDMLSSRRNQPRPKGLPLLAVALLFGSVWACSAEEGQQWPEQSVGWDFKYYFDFNNPKQDLYKPPQYDGATPQPDSGQGDSASDGSSNNDGASDGSSTCPAPSGAKCTPACPSKSLCTPAKGGMCATTYHLIGPASNKQVLSTVAMAYSDCWAKQPKADTLCSTFDACKMTGTLTESMIRDWVCKVAKASDFPSQKKYDDAYSVCGCSIIGVDRPDWKITSIGSNKKGVVCLSYNVVSFTFDWVEVNNCSAFPPK